MILPQGNKAMVERTVLVLTEGGVRLLAPLAQAQAARSVLVCQPTDCPTVQCRLEYLVLQSGLERQRRKCPGRQDVLAGEMESTWATAHLPLRFGSEAGQ